jgi:hypothetical protein
LKFGGLVVIANAWWDKMASFSPLSHKSLGKMGKLMKRLGQGGPMRLLLVWLHPFTNTLRLSMLVLRTMESSHFYRMEVFVEESMGYIGNRISHKVADTGVDTFVAKILIPESYFTFTHHLSCLLHCGFLFCCASPWVLFAPWLLTLFPFRDRASVVS